MNQELINYINQAKSSGKTNDQIRQELLGSGWAVQDIEEALGGNGPTALFPQAGLLETQKPRFSFKFPKKLFKILIILIIVVAVVIGGYFALAKYFPQYAKYVQPYLGPILDPIMEKIGLSVPSPTTNQINSSLTNSKQFTIPDDWKTATFEDLKSGYSFEVKVPNGWEVQENVAELFYPIDVNDLLFFGKLRPTDLHLTPSPLPL